MKRRALFLAIFSVIVIVVLGIFLAREKLEESEVAINDVVERNLLSVSEEEWVVRQAFQTDDGSLFISVLENIATSATKESLRRLQVDKQVSGATTTVVNDAVIMCADCGGIWGDPFESVSATDADTLLVKHYGGSSWRWSYELTFSFVDSRWKLAEVQFASIWTGAPEEPQIETYSFTADDYGDITIDEFPGYDFLQELIKISEPNTVPSETISANLTEDEKQNSEIISPQNNLPEAIELSEDKPVLSVTSAHQDTIMTGHNTARAKKGLSPLSWSPTVAASAQTWADTLGNAGCRMTHSTSVYGENLYYSWTSGDLTLNPKEAVKWWVAEEQYYDYAANTCAPGEQCGHYTQIVWDDTREVGCGVTTCEEPGKNTQMWVCQYSPAGNIIGDRPY